MNHLMLSDFSVNNFFGNLIFLQTSSSMPQSWFTPYGQNGPLWSLAAEFFFYSIFPVAYILNLQFLNKLNVNLKFLLLLIISLVCLAINKMFFVPYFMFMSSFIIWLFGYVCSLTYLNGKKYGTLFLGCIIFAISYLTIGYRIFSSETFVRISQGMIIGSVFYVCVIGLQSLWFEKLFKGPVKVINNVFFHIGKGSFALYALHYPIILLLLHYKFGVEVQVAVILLLALLCPVLEETTIKWKMGIFSRNYVGYLRRKVGYYSSI